MDAQASQLRQPVPDARLKKEIETVAREALRSQGKRNPSDDQVRRKMLHPEIVKEAKYRLENPGEPHWPTLQWVMARGKD
jgi:hypothetical protein